MIRNQAGNFVKSRNERGYTLNGYTFEPLDNGWHTYHGGPTVVGGIKLAILIPAGSEELPEECREFEKRQTDPAWQWTPIVDFQVNSGNGAAWEQVHVPA